MTVAAQTIPSSRRYPTRTAAEVDRAFGRAARHSQHVTILRKALPALAVVVIAGYFISSGLSVTVDGVTASIDGMEIKDGKLRMVNPKLKGADKKNGPYLITADFADQHIKNPKIMDLHAINAEVSNPSGGWSRMKAIRGTLNSASERLVLRDDIRIATSSGVDGTLTQASLDMKNQIVRSHVPVSFNLPNGTVRAKAMTLYSGKKIIVFRGKVKVHLDKPQTDATADGKPAAAQPAAQEAKAEPTPASDDTNAVPLRRDPL